MNTSQLILRCYARYDEGQWVAICLNFDLAAQADTFEEAKMKLESMIKAYVFDALVGEDKEYAKQLLSRKAPLFEWLKYGFYWLQYHFSHAKKDLYHLFYETLPLTPYHHESV